MGLAEPLIVLLPHVAAYPVIADPPVLPGAVNTTDIWWLPGVTEVIVGAPGGVLYIRPEALVSEPLLLGVNVTGPTAVGVIVKVCAAAEALKVSTIGVESPPPDGVMVIVPV